MVHKADAHKEQSSALFGGKVVAGMCRILCLVEDACDVSVNTVYIVLLWSMHPMHPADFKVVACLSCFGGGGGCKGEGGRAKQLNNRANTSCWFSGMGMLLCPAVHRTLQHDYAVLSSAYSKLLNALQVYLASASPPVRYPNVYGVDMPTKKEFVATDLSEEEIRKVESHVSWSANHVAMLSFSCNRWGAWSETHATAAVCQSCYLACFAVYVYVIQPTPI